MSTYFIKLYEYCEIYNRLPSEIEKEDKDILEIITKIKKEKNDRQNSTISN